ncbi:hypothetical protein LOD99_2928 [Oopsacas minuta]|uniref:Uncharacterized protein n=1 Tax=Oopsacas minuta TaxID=111878 RepID=A0AAV7JYT7_9METZ|nr:hypothetical protein LOD99_2928 [Oopsacas minuta]
MIQLNVNVPLVNGDTSLQKLVDNIQLLTKEDSSIEKIKYKMESLEEQVADIVVRVSKCEDQAGTVEDVLEKLNRLSESIDVLQEDNRSIREIERNDVTEMRDMLESLNIESRGIMERVEDMDKMSTRYVTCTCFYLYLSENYNQLRMLGYIKCIAANRNNCMDLLFCFFIEDPC